MPRAHHHTLSKDVKERIIKFLKTIKGVHLLKDTPYCINFKYNNKYFAIEDKYSVHQKDVPDATFYYRESSMFSKDFNSFKERLPKFINLDFSKRYYILQNDKIMKPFYYKGQTITASCKEEAIKQIIAKTFDFK